MNGRATAGMGLTPKQAELFGFIQAFVGEFGYPPSYRNMMAGLGRTSMGSLHGCIEKLIERGRLRRWWGQFEIIEPMAPAPEPGLHVIYGPGHWEDRARLNRAVYAREAA